MTGPRLTFVTRGGSVAVLGTFAQLSLSSLRFYVRSFPLHWVTA